MIKVTLGTNTTRTVVIVPDYTTLREVLEENEIDYSTGALHLDGASIRPGDLDRSFEALGITEKTYLINVVKADSAKC